MKEQVSSILDERYYEIDHPTGLKIFVMPKAHYRSAYAVIGTKYGSIDNRFKRSDAAEYTEVPEGIAHFLEHKLFESEELDAFQRFAATGASANAYTSFDKTCYLFQCSDHFDQSLEILLDFVQHPYFTPQTVEKEQGIIGQEITMYYDVPGWMSTFNLLRCLYKNHPVRIDIAGTVESISHITDKLLYDCYNTFYNLHNMALAVVGNVTPEQVLAICDRCLKPTADVTVERAFLPEPREIVQDYQACHLATSIPVFSFGYKEACTKPEQDIETIILTNLLLEIMAGDSSPLYKDLFDRGLISSEFSTEYFHGHGYEAIIFDGESTDPRQVAAAIQAEVERLRREGIPEDLYQAALRKSYGREVMSYNDIDSVANGMIDAHFNGFSIFDVTNRYKAITKEKIEARLQQVMNPQYSALSVVKAEEDQHE